MAIPHPIQRRKLPVNCRGRHILPPVFVYATLATMRKGKGWRTEQREGLRYYCLIDPEGGPGDGILVQGIFTRRGGVSRGPWKGPNVGHAAGDEWRAVEANRIRICRALNIPRQALTTAQQVHGVHIAHVRPEGLGRTFPATDGLVTNVPGIALMLHFADCVPLLFFDPRHLAVGLAHAGWRGTLAGIANRMAEAMDSAFGSRPEDLMAGIGPAIGPCCYEVGHGLARRVQAQFPQWPDLIHWQKGAPYFDLWLANRRQLEAAGVRSIAMAECCTACHVEEFYSYRAEGGQTGRFAAVIGLRKATWK